MARWAWTRTASPSTTGTFSAAPCPASQKSWTFWPTWAWRPSTSAPSSARQRTTATAPPTTRPSTRCWVRKRTFAPSATPPTPAGCGCCWTGCSATPAPPPATSATRLSLKPLPTTPGISGSTGRTTTTAGGASPPCPRWTRTVPATGNTSTEPNIPSSAAGSGRGRTGGGWTWRMSCPTPSLPVCGRRCGRRTRTP